MSKCKHANVGQEIFKVFHQEIRFIIFDVFNRNKNGLKGLIYNYRNKLDFIVIVYNILVSLNIFIGKF